MAQQNLRVHEVAFCSEVSKWTDRLFDGREELPFGCGFRREGSLTLDLAYLGELRIGTDVLPSPLTLCPVAEVIDGTRTRGGLAVAYCVMRFELSVRMDNW